MIWTRQTHTAEGPCAPAVWQYDLDDPAMAAGVAALQAGAAGHALYPAMDVAARDIVIDKYRYGAFSCPAGTSPAPCRPTRRWLSSPEPDQLLLRDHRPGGQHGRLQGIFVSDATASLTDAEHNAALLNLRLNFADVRFAGEVLAMIAAA